MEETAVLPGKNKQTCDTPMTNFIEGKIGQPTVIRTSSFNITKF
jgi:hypothetical protein